MQSEQRSFKFSARAEAWKITWSHAVPGGLELQIPPPMGHSGRSPLRRLSWRPRWRRGYPRLRRPEVCKGIASMLKGVGEVTF